MPYGLLCAITRVILIAQYFFGISAKWKSALNFVKGLVIQLYIGKSNVTFGIENNKWERVVITTKQKTFNPCRVGAINLNKSIAEEENLNYRDGPQTRTPKLFALRSFSVEVNQPITSLSISQKAQFPA